MTNTFPYSPAEIDRQLQAKIPNWTFTKGKLTLVITCNTFSETIRLTNQIALLAEKYNHHPELHLSFVTLIIELYTHDLNGITQKDFDLAEEINTLL